MVSPARRLSIADCNSGSVEMRTILEPVRSSRGASTENTEAVKQSNNNTSGNIDPSLAGLRSRTTVKRSRVSLDSRTKCPRSAQPGNSREFR